MTKNSAVTMILALTAAIVPVIMAGCGGKPSVSGAKADWGSPGTPDTRWYAAKPKAKSFTISTADELAGLAAIVNGTWGGTPARQSFVGKIITLAADIDLSAYGNWTPIGRWDPSANKALPFSGVFEGGRHTVANLKIDRPGANDQGLFGYIERGQVKNLGLEDADISGGTTVGAIAAVVWLKSTVTNCYTTGSVTAAVSYAGGIAGTLVDSSAITRCYSAAKVGAGDHAGGITGRVGGNSAITNCAALNPQVSASDMNAKSGRVTGSMADAVLGPVILSNNIAWAEMKNATGDTAWPKKGANTQNGEDISTSQITAGGTLGGRFKGPLTTKNGNLPGLQ
ncbi:MAG: hypothetical protein FWB85_05975 [Chitinispirillia bacterium]|nr:hypothetical protein [Chitinispirillia bacterium]